MSDEQVLADGERVTAFLADPAVKAAIERLDKRYYTEFVNSTGGADELRSIKAKSNALAELLIELQAVVDGGKRVRADIERKERMEKHQQKYQPRNKR